MRAAMSKNATTMRRQRCTLCCNLFLPVTFLLIAFLVQALLLDSAIAKMNNETEMMKIAATDACAKVTEAMERACNDRVSLKCKLQPNGDCVFEKNDDCVLRVLLTGGPCGEPTCASFTP